jgi:hypothetical protein
MVKINGKRSVVVQNKDLRPFTVPTTQLARDGESGGAGRTGRTDIRRK